MKKKMLAIFLAGVMALSVTACGGTANRNSDETNVETQNTQEMVSFQNAEDVSAFFDEIYQGVSNELIPKMIESIDMDLEDKDMVTYNTGLTDLSQIEGITLSESAMSSVAYSALFIRTKDGADVEGIATEIMDKIDPRKWICVGAEKQLIAQMGNDLFYVMGSKDTVKAVFDSAAKAAQSRNLSVNIISEKTNE